VKLRQTEGAILVEPEWPTSAPEEDAESKAKEESVGSGTRIEVITMAELTRRLGGEPDPPMERKG
jgi:hypothetical protein